MFVLVDRVIKDPSSTYEWYQQGLRIGKLPKNAVAYRKWLNNANDDQFPDHPSPEKALQFKILEHHLIPLDMPVRRKLVVVETEDDLKFCVNELKLVDQIAFDCERDKNFNYRTLTSAIQISTNKCDFFIDTVRLYDKIEEYLSPIFLDENKIKLVFDTVDLREIQKDFRIFFQAVVDVQHVVKTILGLQLKPDLESVVRRYVDEKVVLNKSFQRFPWRMRELPLDAIKYAVADSYYLFLVWEMLKCQKQEFLLNEYDNARVNVKVVQKYKNPRLKPIRLFGICTRSEIIDFRNELKFDDHFFLFRDLLMYATDKAKERDCPRYVMLCNKYLAILAYKKPKTTDELHNLIPSSKNWPLLRQIQIITLIELFGLPPVIEPIQNDSDEDDLQVIFDSNDSRRVSVIRNDVENGTNEGMEVDNKDLSQENELQNDRVENEMVSDILHKNDKDLMSNNVEMETSKENECKDFDDDDELIIDCNMDIDIVEDTNGNYENENIVDSEEFNVNNEKSEEISEIENCNLNDDNLDKNMIEIDNDICNDVFSENIASIDVQNEKVTKYDCMDDNLIDRISCTELVWNWYEIRSSKLSNRRKNYLRTKRNFIMKGVKRLRSLERRFGKFNK